VVSVRLPAAVYPRYPLDRRLGGPQLVWTQRLEENFFELKKIYIATCYFFPLWLRSSLCWALILFFPLPFAPFNSVSKKRTLWGLGAGRCVPQEAGKQRRVTDANPWKVDVLDKLFHTLQL
jgi:hypothetical protein